MAPSEGPEGLDDLVTETRGGNDDYDHRSTLELVELMNDRDATVPGVVGEASSAIAEVIDAAVDRLKRGGRLIYAGAGSSPERASRQSSRRPRRMTRKPVETPPRSCMSPRKTSSSASAQAAAPRTRLP